MIRRLLIASSILVVWNRAAWIGLSLWQLGTFLSRLGSLDSSLIQRSQDVISAAAARAQAQPSNAECVTETVSATTSPLEGSVEAEGAEGLNLGVPGEDDRVLLRIPMSVQERCDILSILGRYADVWTRDHGFPRNFFKDELKTFTDIEDYEPAQLAYTDGLGGPIVSLYEEKHRSGTLHALPACALFLTVRESLMKAILNLSWHAASWIARLFQSVDGVEARACLVH